MDLPMKGDRLPDKDHVARYCPGSKLSEDGFPAATAFHLRRREEFLSVEWLEHLARPTRQEEVDEVIRTLSRKLNLTSSSKLAVMNVGDICRTVLRETTFSIRVLHEPSKGDGAHSGIFGIDQDEMIISELLAENLAGCYDIRR